MAAIANPCPAIHRNGELDIYRKDRWTPALHCRVIVVKDVFWLMFPENPRFCNEFETQRTSVKHGQTHLTI